MARISVLVVTYQHERYIAEALQSVLGQTRAVDEIVVVDDGSTDRTLEVVSMFRDPRLTVMDLPHRGIEQLAETYNLGLARATGTLVAVLEGDDRWRPDKVATQAEVFADPSVVVAHGLYAVIGARGDLLRARVGPAVQLREGAYDALPLHLRMSYIMPVTAMVRRAALERIGGFQQLPGTPHTDHPTYLALAEIGRFHYQDRVLAEWRKHGGSGTMRLTGVDLTGTRLSRDLALTVRSRSARRDLPTVEQIGRDWDEAYARQLWHASRLLLVQKRFEEAEQVLRLYGDIVGLPVSHRGRLVLARMAALFHTDLEWLTRPLSKRSPYSQLD